MVPQTYEQYFIAVGFVLFLLAAFSWLFLGLFLHVSQCGE